MCLTINNNDLNLVHLWVDATYIIHDELKGHTGATTSIRKGGVTSIPRKQNINTTSSTQSEIVGVYDFSPQVMCTKYFLQNQGFHANNSVAYQDNKSDISLEKNGRTSSSNHKKHVNINYFFIQDHVDTGELTVVHCPTDEMTGDYFTQPPEGDKFRKFGSQIMGLTDEEN